jgi:hypothetical protein
MGFHFLDPDDTGQIAAWLKEPKSQALEANYALARPLFDITNLPTRLAELLSTLDL